MKGILRGWLGPALLSLSFAATAEFHTYVIDELYSNADGTVQYLVMRESMGANGENLWTGNALTATHAGTTKTFVFKTNLPGGECGYYGCMVSQTANTRVLIATQGFASLRSYLAGLHDPERLFATDGVTVNYAGVDQVTFSFDPHGRH